jgi:hypothetical protein
MALNKERTMNETIHLAEQHILESLARLKHIDEQMAKAEQSHITTPLPPAAVSKLAALKQSRDGLAQQLATLQSQPLSSDPHHAASHSEGIKGGLEVVGEELKNVLGSVFRHP